ncbi:Antigen KI-67 [Armadillidium nasatum]|uniref:Antigen KI-67 n=1 Tax=Armadillidium nasatum TaxID=96803 RepID=A0A5N5SXJ3_9CRUS|nr:Antigen KI-67 [Armadillidium nasatum]
MNDEKKTSFIVVVILVKFIGFGMKVYGYVVVIKRAGGDYTSYPLTTKRCIIGKNNDCDIRIQLPSVSKLHCKIEVDDAGKAYITNLNRNNSTLLNDEKIPSEQPIDLYHNDVIIIADRKFRWEYSEITKYSYHMHKQSNETVQQSASQSLAVKHVNYLILANSLLLCISSICQGRITFSPSTMKDTHWYKI